MFNKERAWSYAQEGLAETWHQKRDRETIGGQNKGTHVGGHPEGAVQKVPAVTKGGGNAATDGTDLCWDPSNKERDLTHWGSHHDDARTQRCSTEEKLNTIEVEAMKTEGIVIYRGTKDLGNAFYADWVMGNLKDVVIWHNTEMW